MAKKTKIKVKIDGTQSDIDLAAFDEMLKKIASVPKEEVDKAIKRDRENKKTAKK